jgi:hypothetical protein
MSTPEYKQFACFVDMSLELIEPVVSGDKLAVPKYRFFDGAGGSQQINDLAGLRAINASI